MKFTEMIEQGKDAATVGRVFGEPYERDGVTIIPAASVRGGGGGGDGGRDGGNGDGSQGSGGGFGVSARPVGAYIVKDGDVVWVPAVDQTRVVILGQVAGLLALMVVRTLVRRLVKKR